MTILIEIDVIYSTMSETDVTQKRTNLHETKTERSYK
jgi:hypothetical protein